MTRQVSKLVEIELERGETLTGTPQHPIWSMERQEWIELGELEVGEHLWTEEGPIEIIDHRFLTTGESVYNIEVHGHHIYQVGELGMLVHNAGKIWRLKTPKPKNKPKTIYVDRKKSPEAVKHLKDVKALNRTLTLDRKGALLRRKNALRGKKREKGKDRDEAPPAVFKEGSKSVRNITSGDNRSAGAQIGNQLRKLKDGTRIQLRPR